MKDLYQKLWLPTMTECVDLVLSLSSGFLKNPIQNSWFSIKLQAENTNLQNLQKTCYQSQQCLLPEIMELDQQNIENKEFKRKNKKKKKKKKKVKSKDDNEFNSIKLRIYPDIKQKQLLNKWFGATRFIYNKCLNYINTNRGQENLYKLKNLRNLFINNKNYETENKWMDEIPYDIRDESVRDLLKNFNSNFKKNTGFNIKYKSKKSINSINVLSKHWASKTGMYSKVFKNLKAERVLPKHLEYTCRILKNELNKYYICIPRPIEKILKTSENQTCLKKNLKTPRKCRVCSIDPGIITFATIYDIQGYSIKWGDKDIENLARLLHYKNKLQSRINKSKIHKIRYSYKKAYKRLSIRIKNLVEDCHKKLAKWLCQNYDVILIPKLSFHNLSKLNRKHKAKLAVWSQCSFVDRLIHKSKSYKDCKVIEIKEDYTSKTCGNCGFVKNNLYNSRTYCCDRCHSVLDRDVNGSRCGLLKYLTEHKEFERTLWPSTC